MTSYLYRTMCCDNGNLIVLVRVGCWLSHALFYWWRLLFCLCRVASVGRNCSDMGVTDKSSTVLQSIAMREIPTGAVVLLVKSRQSSFATELLSPLLLSLSYCLYLMFYPNVMQTVGVCDSSGELSK